MRLQRLLIEDLRILAQVEVRPVEGVNWLVGPNGAGKTSVLEAVYLLSSGRSFRSGSVDACVRRGAAGLTVYAEMESATGALRRVGLRRQSRSFEGRVDGETVSSLAELFLVCPAVCFQPDAAELILGGGELRRRFLDWGLFHVEQDFLVAWRRFNRALRQRNLLLRTRRRTAEEEAWRVELAEVGVVLHELRRLYVESLLPALVEVSAWLLPDLGPPRLQFRPGWAASEESLAQALGRGLEGDLRQGFTGVGPQRAGWSLSYERIPQREMFSRGQAKLAALCMLLAQISGFVAKRGEAPVVALDDALAELDPGNQRRLLDYLAQFRAQVLLASADTGLIERHGATPESVFHVEQGRVRQGV